MSNEKRVLKPLKKRKPEESTGYPDLISSIVKETKYRKSDVKIVVDCMIDKVVESLNNKKSVNLPRIGILFPTIKRSRVGMSLNGNVGKPTKMMVPDRWLPRFQASKCLRQSLSELIVLPKELDALYK